MKQEDFWWIGVILAVFAALFGSLGDNLIKLSYTQALLIEEAGGVPPGLFCRPLWLAGMFCVTILNTSMTLMSYTFADASLTIPFAGLHICFNVIFARSMNKESFTSRQLGFTLIILLGVTIVLVTGNHDTKSFPIEDLEELFTNVPYFVMTGIILLGIGVLIPLAFTTENPRMRCFGSSTLCGLVGSCTQVYAKTMSESFDQAVNADSSAVFSSFVPYVAIFLTLVCATFQLVLLNRSLSLYNAFVVVPFVNSTLIVFGSLYATIFFEEGKRLEETSRVLMPVGILATALGVGLLAWDHDPTLVFDEGEQNLAKRLSSPMNRSPRDRHRESQPTRSPTRRDGTVRLKMDEAIGLDENSDDVGMVQESDTLTLA